MNDARNDDPIGQGAYGDGAIEEVTVPGTDPVRTAKDRDLGDPADRELELEELRNGGPTRTPGIRTTTGGNAGPAAVAARLREHRRPNQAPGASGTVAPTTTGDATSGGMDTPVRGSTSDATTGGAEAGDFTDR
jgi:hypothetical protein